MSGGRRADDDDSVHFYYRDDDYDGHHDGHDDVGEFSYDAVALNANTRCRSSEMIVSLERSMQVTNPSPQLQPSPALSHPALSSLKLFQAEIISLRSQVQHVPPQLCQCRP